jgi:hypothetical protein
MNRKGRPKSERAAHVQIVRIKLRLYPGEDDDLIAFFSTIPTGLRAASAKRALREGCHGGCANDRPPAEELLDALDAFIS